MSKGGHFRRHLPGDRAAAMGEHGFVKFRERALGMKESPNKINRKLNSPPFSSHVSHWRLPGREQRGAWTRALKTPQLIDKHKGSHFFSGSNHLFAPAEVNAASWWPAQGTISAQTRVLVTTLTAQPVTTCTRTGTWVTGSTWAVLEFGLWPREVDGVC